MKTVDWTGYGGNVLSVVIKDGNFIEKEIGTLGLGVSFKGGLGRDYCVSEHTPFREIINRLSGVEYSIKNGEYLKITYEEYCQGKPFDTEIEVKVNGKPLSIFTRSEEFMESKKFRDLFEKYESLQRAVCEAEENKKEKSAIPANSKRRK